MSLMLEIKKVLRPDLEWYLVILEFLKPMLGIIVVPENRLLTLLSIP